MAINSKLPLNFSSNIIEHMPKNHFLSIAQNDNHEVASI